ncbi:MAG: SBBP repeat-containing protein [bacterium]
MKLSRIIGVLGILLLTILLAMTQKGSFSTDQNSADATVSANDPADTKQAFGKLPLAFEANEGQTGDAVQFMARGPGYGLFLTGERVAMSLDGPDETGFGLHLVLVGANPEAQAEGVERLPGASNYFKGSDPEQWQTNVAQYRKVRYDDIWPGIDVVYYGKQGQLEYDFVIAPGIDPSAISLSFDGAEAISLADGELVLATATGDVVLREPVLYQQHDSYLARVDGKYALLADNQVGFEIGDYDPSRELVIDPVLFYSTYLGGNGFDGATRIEVDAAGNAYLAGVTPSANFPTTAGAFDVTHNSPGLRDNYLAKLDPTGTTLLYSTFIGGSNHDHTDGRFLGLKVDAAGNAYLVADPRSNDYPTTSGAFQTAFGGGQSDIAVTKLNPTGTALVYSTYVGGNNTERVGDHAIALGTDGSVYVAGLSLSANFPVTAGVFDQTINGQADGVVFKLNPSGTALDWATFLGGAANEGVNAVEVDAAGNVYVAGGTRSTNFPLAGSPPDAVFSGTPLEAYAAKLNPSGTALLYSTFIGGSNNDEAIDLVLDAAGNAYVTGYTKSTDFPTVSPVQAAFGGGGSTGDLFVTKINAGGTAFSVSTYLGGNGNEFPSNIILDASARIYVGGNTASTDFPTVNHFQNSLIGGLDATLTRLSADGSTIEFSTYFGCTGNDFITDIQVDAAGALYAVGGTSSTDFPVTTSALQSTLAGGFDCFITKMDPDAPGTHVCGTPPPEVPSNQDPDCNLAAIADQNADASCGATISGADVTGVTDPDGDPLTITVNPTTLVLGANVVTVMADDGNGGSCSTDITVNVVDNTPPVITADLISVPGDDDDEEDDDNDEGRFAVQCSATDNCSSILDLTAVMQAPSLTNPTVEFHVKKENKLKYDLKKNKVKVAGPDPHGLWAAVQSAGGVAVNDGQELKLKITGDHKHEFKFDKNGNLKEVKGTEAPVLVCTATDAAGNVGTATVSADLSKDDDDDDDDHNGKAHKSAVSNLESLGLPGEFGLAQNHPNPFNPTTVISFAVPEAGKVKLTIYNMMGQLVKTLYYGQATAGEHKVVWNARNESGVKVASGVYIYRLEAKNFQGMKRLILMK